MDDMLRTIRHFEPMVKAIDAVYMVETSQELIKQQHKRLCGDSPLEEHELGKKSVSKYASIPIIWTENIRFIPSNPSAAPFIVAHEFFDALPIHAFESVPPAPEDEQPHTITTPTGTHQVAPEARKKAAASEPQWRELVVSPAPPGSTHEDLGTPLAERDLYPPPEFELTRAKASTPHSLYLPEISDRYKGLRKTPGSIIEISPESHVYMQQIAQRIGGSKEAPKKPSGAALILDYGTLDTIPVNSLRGIRDHKRVSPLTQPGLVDLSADVDFVALAEAALNASEGVEVYGPVEQGFFLLSMGIKERADILVKNQQDEQKKQSIEGAWKRLIDRGPNGMGKVYKALAVVPESGGTKRPVGFGGQLGA
jgi:SAM-dependent MidA family methyltransferase